MCDMYNLQKKAKKWVLVFAALSIGMTAFIWGNSSMSRAQSSGQSLSLLAWLKPLLDPAGRIDEELFHILIRKTAHFAEFGALGLCVGGFAYNLGRLRQRLYVALPMLITLGVAVMDEFLQLFSARGSLVEDIVLDYCGALAGLLFVALIGLLMTRKKVKRFVEK